MMQMAADISPCGTWRYSLKRIWRHDLPMLVVCMLNPSTADGTENDPTISTLIKFATSWGFGGLWVVNQNAFRSPHPSVMAAQDECTRQGPLNFLAWHEALTYASANGGWALAAWGNGGDNDHQFTVWCDLLRVELRHMGTTGSGAPKHPLARGKHRISADIVPSLWRSPRPLFCAPRTPSPAARRIY